MKNGKTRKGNTKRTTESKVYADSNDRATTNKRGGKSDSYRNGINDVAWYSKNPVMMEAAANFSFLAAQGSNYRIGNTNVEGHNVLQSEVWTHTNPGIMALDFIPTFGANGQKYDALNSAAQNIFTYIRNTNSGAKNYDAPDLMMYLLALDNIYMMWNYVKTAYGVSRTFNALNKYMAQNTIKAMGFVGIDSEDDLANIRMRLNMIAAKTATLSAPANLSVMLRHSFLTSNIFADEPNGKAAFYLFRPMGMYMFSETASAKGSSLIWVHLTSSIKNQLDMLESALNHLLYSYDVGIISGDILKAFGEGGLFKLSPISEDFTVIPTFNPSVLTQIENLYTYPVDMESLEITQDIETLTIDNPIKADLAIVDDYPPYNLARRVLNMHTLNPSAGDVMEATRLITCPGKNHLELKVYGTEIVRSMQVYYITEVDGVNKLYQTSILPSCIYYEGFTPLIAHIWTKFNYAPRIDVITLSGVDYKYQGSLGDLDVFTVLDDDQIENVHSVALYSLWNVPSTANF